MTTRTARSEEEAEAIVDQLVAAIDLRAMAPDLEQAIGAHFLDWWGRRFDRTDFVHTPFTVRQRDAQPEGSYYGDAQPNSRSRPGWPFFEWTGAIRESVSRFTTVGHDEASIDSGANYQGPLNEADPFASIVAARAGLAPDDDRLIGLDVLSARLDTVVDGYLARVAATL